MSKSSNPWDKVKKKNGKLTGMLTDDLTKNILLQNGRLTLTASGLSIVRIPKSTKRK